MSAGLRSRGFIHSVIDEQEVQNAYDVHAQIPLHKRVNLQIGEYDVNIDQNLITVTEDKIQLCLAKNLAKIGGKRWLHPLSLLSSLLLALATSEFDKLAWVSSELLRAIFIVSSMITAGWLIWEIMNASRTKEVPAAIDDIFRDLRGQSMVKNSLQTQITFEGLQR